MISRIRAIATLVILTAVFGLSISPALAQMRNSEVKGISSGLAQRQNSEVKGISSGLAQRRNSEVKGISSGLAQMRNSEVKGISSGLAQDAVRLSRLTIRLWPEFDKPGVLVFLIGQTAEGAALPAELKFALPQGATVNAVAYIDTVKDILSDLPYTVDESNVLTTSPNGNFHIEFYDPALRNSSGLRTYSYTWQQNFTIDELVMEVQQPAGAADFKVDPPGGTNATDENGLSVYRLVSTNVAAGQAVTLSVGYSKQNDGLTVDQLSSGQQSPTAATTQPSGDDNTLSIVIGAVVLALVVAGIVVMYLRGGFQGIGVRVVGADAQEPRERKPRGRAAKKLGKKPAPGQRFCPQCGQPARPGDLFCRSCGTKLHG